MTKIKIFLSSFILILLCTFGLFAGCSNPLDNLKIKVTGEGLVETTEENVFDLTLIKNIDDNDNTWSTVVDVEILGLGNGMKSSVEWNYNAQYVEITYLNDDRTSARIKGKTSTFVPSDIVLFSSETEKVSAKIRVTNIVRALGIDGLAFSEGSFGIPLNTDFVLNPSDLFVFSPVDATAPVYEFDINGVKVNSNETFRLTTLNDGYVNITATPKNQEDYTLEELQDLTYVIENVRIYTILSDDSLGLHLLGETEQVTEIELIKNSTTNSAVVVVDVDTNVDCKVEALEGILYDEATNPKGKLQVEFNAGEKTLTFIGLDALEGGADIGLTFTVSGIENSIELKKTIRVTVVDLPDAIAINGNVGTEAYVLRVFDKYSSGIEGANLKVDLTPFSMIYNNVSIRVDSAETDALLVDDLLINSKKFTGTLDIKSGDVLTLKNAGESGQIYLWVYAKDTEKTDNVVKRQLIISLELGVTGIYVDSDYLDSNNGKLNMQIDAYSNSNFKQKTLEFLVEPLSASADTVTITSGNEQIVSVKSVDFARKTLVVEALAYGETQIHFVAQSGARYSLNVNVLMNLNYVAVDLGADVQGISTGPKSMKSVTVGGHKVETLVLANIAKSGTTVSLENTFYPQSAVDAKMISNVSFESSQSNICNAYIANSNVYESYLETLASGLVDITVKVKYLSIGTTGDRAGVDLIEAEFIQTFKVQVFIPIESVSVSINNLDLLAVPAGSGGESDASAYDIENNSAVVNFEVLPSNAYMQASMATWTKVTHASRYNLDTTTGESVVVSAVPMRIQDRNITDGTLTVQITDLNGVVYTKTVTIKISKINKIKEIYINRYEDTVGNNLGLYFELSKINTEDGKFELDLSFTAIDSTKEITNKNVEYIVYDAIKIDKYEQGAIRVNAEYFRVLPRDDKSIYYDQYVAQNARIIFNNTTKNYEIVPNSQSTGGYAFVFIIPQDGMSKKITDESYNTLPASLQNITDTGTIRRIPVIVADGKVVPYRLFDAEDVVSIGTPLGLDKNYYLMNTIDMSSYFISNLTWEPIGSAGKPFTGNITSYGYEFGESSTEGEITPVLSISGWKISREWNEAEPLKSASHLLNFGIFGVMSGTISNVNFYINSFSLEQSTSRADLSGHSTLNNYNFGLLVGRMDASYAENGDLASVASLVNVSVYCNKFEYKNNRQAGFNATTNLNVNLGVVGMLQANCVMDQVSSNIVGDIESDDLLINYGGLVGRNYGIIGSKTGKGYANFTESTVNAKIYYDIVKAKESSFGGLIGENFGELYCGNSSGEITVLGEASVGGSVGVNSKVISKVLSAVALNACGNVGGVLGYGKLGSISDAYYEIYSLVTKTGMVAYGNVGGIAGRIDAGTLVNGLVLGYDINEENSNIFVSSGYFGGLVGMTYGEVTILNSFANASFDIADGTFGGLVGSASGLTGITDCYARGIVLGNASFKGAFAGYGENSGFNQCYAEFNVDLNAVASGSINANNLVILTNQTTEVLTNISKVLKTEEEIFGQEFWTDRGFDFVNTWELNSNINDGYPSLVGMERIIPKSISVSAKDLEIKNQEGKINNYIKFDNDKIVVIYDENNREPIKVSDLFTLVSDPVIDSSELSLHMTSSSVNVQFVNNNNFNTATIRITGTGTAVLSFESKQNRNARAMVQISVINGFNEFKLYEGEEADYNKEITSLGADDDKYLIRVKYGENNQIYAQFKLDGQEDDLVNVDGGLKFNVANINYKVSIDDWKGEQGNYYYYLDNTTHIVLASSGENFNSNVTKVTPYFKVNFYDILDFNIGELKQYYFELSEEEKAFEVIQYKGASRISTEIGVNTTIHSGDALSSSVTVYTDNYIEGNLAESYVGYSIYSVEDGIWSDIPLCSTVEKDSDNNFYVSNDVFLSFGTPVYYEDTKALVIPYVIELSMALKYQIKEPVEFAVKFWALNDNGEKIENINASMEWTVIAQKVNSVEIVHFSDVVDQSSQLAQAGEYPTNTIIAGEYGLLRVAISPDFVNFDYVEVVSDVVNGGMMIFDQRVLKLDGENRTYISYQQGVESVENGLRLARVSNLGGAFDGIFYLRTYIAPYHQAGTEFTIRVNIALNGQVQSYARTMTVYQTDILSISADNYNMETNKYLVASNTGYNSDSGIFAQNINELNVQVGDSYFAHDVTYSYVADGQVVSGSINPQNGKYYLNTMGIAVGTEISVTLTGYQNLAGLTNKIKRTINFVVVDIVIKGINTFDNGLNFAYVKNKLFNLRLFEGVENIDDLGDISLISFDITNMETAEKVLGIINYLNGVNLSEDSFNSETFGWTYKQYVAEENNYVYNQIEEIIFNATLPNYEDGEWIDGNFKVFWDQNQGYRILGQGISNTSVLRYDFSYGYSLGVLDLNGSGYALSSGDLNLNFYQVTSQEHPIPIYELYELIGMEEGKDYILMNNLSIVGMDWNPINTAISSLNGNGYVIEFRPNLKARDNDINYGFFGKVNKNTVLKNITLSIDKASEADNRYILNIADDITSLKTLNFGVLAGQNEGAIYNCEVRNTNSQVGIATSSDNTAVFNVAGLVASNSGVITNSRVNGLRVTASGYVAGFVVQNSGTISGSYFVGDLVNNITLSNYATAGFVYENTSTAQIVGSYVGGAKILMEDGQFNEEAIIRDATITSGVTTAGFVFENAGYVGDSYSAVKILATKSSGFVFENGISGRIYRSFSISDLTSTGVTALSFPFVGVEGTASLDNNNLNKVDGIVDCYYYDTGFASTRFEEALVLSVKDFMGENDFGVFNNYSFSRSGLASNENMAEFTGVWVFLNNDNLYFTVDRFASGEYVKLGPSLVNADLIATPRLILSDTEIEEETGEAVYTYSREGDARSWFVLSEDKESYTYDPVVVSNIKQFNDAFSYQNDSEIVDDKIVSDIRIINHLDLSELDDNLVFNSPNSKYSGIFEGNGLNFEGLSLVVNDDILRNEYGLIGRLESIEKEDKILFEGTIKNFNIQVETISCSKINYVGALAGIVDGGNLFNIQINGSSSRVLGGNAVGGVVGMVTGKARISNIYSEVGVTASYIQNASKLYNADLIMASGLENAISSIDVLGYAGGLFGIVDISQYDSVSPSVKNVLEARISNVERVGNASIVGKVVGGVAGLVGVYSVLDDALFEVGENGLLRGYTFIGGLVGQNNGVIMYSSIEYEAEVQQLVDASKTGQVSVANLELFESNTEAFAVGGIVGINIGKTVSGWQGGSISFVSSKVAVRNSKAYNVGGIVGASYGGSVKASFTTSSIIGSKTANLGGIIGMINDFGDDNRIVIGIDNPFGEKVMSTTSLDYVVALNNYFAQDFAYYSLIHNSAQANIGGLVGYCAELGLIVTLNSEKQDEFIGYENSIINYFVNQIYDREVNNNVIEEWTTGNFINLDAVGNLNISNVAEGKTRGYILSNYDEVFGKWDEFSIKQTQNGVPEFENGVVPDVFEIRTLEDLNYMYWHPNKSFVLMNDLDFLNSDTGKIDVRFNIIGTESAPFSGQFDGNRKTIKNLTIVSDTVTNLGMFGALEGAVVKNLKLENIHYVLTTSEDLVSYVGGLAGIVKNSVIENVSIVYKNPQENFHKIKTNATYVGGMFGFVTSKAGLKQENLIENCYVDVDIDWSDNVYKKSQNVYAGGMAGKIEDACSVNFVYSKGSISKTSDVDELVISNTLAISTYVGGFAGEINGNSNKQESKINTCITETNINLENIVSNVYAGGFAGLFKARAEKVDVLNELKFGLLKEMSAENNLKNLFVGGLFGQAMGGSATGFITNSDIILNGEYDKVIKQTQMVAGITPITGDTTYRGYSNASIYNNTGFNNFDMGFIQTGVRDVISNSFVKVNANLSRIAKDKYNLGQNGTGRSSLNTTGKTYFAKNSASMAYFALDLNEFNATHQINGTWTASSYYLNYYDASNLGKSKINPIKVDDFNKIDSSQYLYYIQNATLYADILNPVSINGHYNADGYAIKLKVNNSVLNNTNIGIFEVSENSVIAGVVIKDVKVNATLGSFVENFGIVASVVREDGILLNCFVEGEISLEMEEQCNIGGLAGLNYGQIIGSACDIKLDVYGTNGRAGLLVGENSSNLVDKYSIIDSYAVGRITNYGSDMVIGGLVGVADNLFTESVLDVVEVIDLGENSRVYPVVGSLTGGNNLGVYFAEFSAVNTSTLGNSFNYTAFRNGEYDLLSKLGTAYCIEEGKNYGLPMLSINKNVVKDTGDGELDNPYKIYSAMQFDWAVRGDKHYQLEDDIYINLIKNRQALDFAGSLEGNGKFIIGLDSTLFNSIASGARVVGLGLEPVELLTGNILANVVDNGATVEQIFVKASAGAVIGSGMIQNSISNGANFTTSSINCYSSLITDEIFATLDKDIWCYNGTIYTLKAFVEKTGDNLKSANITLTFDENSNTFEISSLADFELAIKYAEYYAENYIFDFVNSSLDLEGKQFYLPSNVQIKGLSKISNGFIEIADNSGLVYGINDVNEIENCGIVLGLEATLFNSIGFDLNNLTLTNNRIFVEKENGALIVGQIINDLNLTMTGNKLFGVGQEICLITQTANLAITVNVDIQNLQLFNIDLVNLVNENNANIVVSLNSVDGPTYLVGTNNGGLEISLDGEFIEFAESYTSNSRIIASLDNILFTKSIMEENLGVIELTLNNVTITQEDLLLIGQNSGTLTFVILNSNLANTLIGVNNIDCVVEVELENSNINALVNENFGQVNVNSDELSVIKTVVNTNNGNNISIDGGSYDTIVNNNLAEQSLVVSNAVINHDSVAVNDGSSVVELNNCVLSEFAVDDNNANLQIEFNGCTFNGTSAINNNSAVVNAVVNNSVVDLADWNLFIVSNTGEYTLTVDNVVIYPVETPPEETV